MPIRDCTGGYKCFRRAALARLDLDAITASGYGFQVEVNYLCRRAGLRLREVPITFPDRRAGSSKMSRAIVLEAALLVWRLRRRAYSNYGQGRDVATIIDLEDLRRDGPRDTGRRLADAHTAHR